MDLREYQEATCKLVRRMPYSTVNEISVAQAGPSEADRVLSILEQATRWLAERGMNHWNGVHTRDRIQIDMDKGRVLLAQNAKGMPVGTVTVRFDPPDYYQASDRKFWAAPDAPAAYIKKLAVIPSLMKRGIAGQLLAAAESDARNTGARFARLDTNASFPQLVPYYQRRGYIKVGEREGSSFFEKELRVVHDADNV